MRVFHGFFLKISVVGVVLLLLNLAHPVVSLRGVATQNDPLFDQILECDIRIASFLSPNLSPEKKEHVEISCVVDDMIYDIPNAILVKYEAELTAPGHKRMLIQGGSLPTDESGRDALGGEFLYPSDANVIFLDGSSSSSRRLKAALGSQRKKGSSNVLVMRVVAKDAFTTMSAESLYDRIFGDGSNVANLGLGDSGTLRQTYLDCSFGQMSFEPAQGYDIVNGVGVVEIDIEVEGTSNRVAENAVTRAINEKYGSAEDWDHIIYCLPKGTLDGKDSNWVAFGYGDWYRTVYEDEYCGQNSVLVHEVGHNIGLQHSNEVQKYTDQTCMLGFSYNWTGGPRMCFNAHKNWVLGWFEDKSIELNPSVEPWGGKLVGFVDYDKASENEYIVIHFLDIYMQYNRAKTFNRQVFEKRDELVIVQAEKDDVPSEALAGLNVGEVFEYQGYVILVCGKGTGTNEQDYIQISVHASGESNVCGTNTGPQAMPTFSPTFKSTLPPVPAATSVPSVELSIEPSIEPSSEPSWKPSQKPSSEPSWKPSSEPPSEPSSEPTQAASSFPSISLTTFPTPTPPPVATDDSCDDTRGEFYVASLAKNEKCVWLKARPQMADLLCEEGHASGAREVCPETCGTCLDYCYDDLSTTVTIDGTSRDCIWLDLRPNVVERECVFGTESWTKCRETCGNCNLSPTGAPSNLPSTTSPSSSSLPTVKNEYDSCDDDIYAKFYVDETNKEEPCQWLHSRAEMRQIYCNASHPAGAYDLCEETCEKCSDECTDDPNALVKVGDTNRKCSFIADRINLVEELCVEGEDAYQFCGETCNSCTGPPENTTISVVDELIGLVP